MKHVAVMLAGGKGTRLYPLSTDKEPKQFLPLLSDKQMIDESIDRIKPIYGDDSIFINSIDEYKGYIENKPYKALIEPYGNGTTSSVLFSVLEIMRNYGDCVITLFPSDHYIEDEDNYRESINKAIDIAIDSDNVVLIGVEPEYAEKGYGYINYKGNKVVEFKEKPDKDKAIQYIENGYLWNSGIFTFKVSVMYDLYKKKQDDIRQGFQYAHKKGFLNSYYKNVDIKPDSFEKSIVEKADHISVVRGRFGWSDIGDLKRYTKLMNEMRGVSWLEKLS